MANFNKTRRTHYYWHKQPVHTPTFIDLDKYLPKPEDSNLSPFNRQYPKPITLSAVNQTFKNDTQPKNSKNKNATTTTASSTASSDHGTLRVNVTREQRTISLSSGEAVYSSSGQESGRRPAKRRHHSVATPGFQDEIEAKRAKTQAKQTARSLKFNPFNPELPVFTLETVSIFIVKLCSKLVHVYVHV